MYFRFLVNGCISANYPYIGQYLCHLRQTKPHLPHETAKQHNFRHYKLWYAPFKKSYVPTVFLKHLI